MDKCPKCRALYEIKHHDYDTVDRLKILRTGRQYECGSVFYSDGAEGESKACLRRQLAAANERAVLLYNSGYMNGHNDTVEGTFIDIANGDMDTYHKDVVRELLADHAAHANREGK